MEKEKCCSSSRGETGEVREYEIVPEKKMIDKIHDDMVLINGGNFLMGSDDKFAYPEDGEGPVRNIKLNSFYIDKFAVTNKKFKEFIDATLYVTEAEKFGWSFVFAGFLPDDFPPTAAVQNAQWWRQVFSSEWKHPEGPQTDLNNLNSEDKMDYPVLHVSWNDANAFCKWSGKRLPTEAEWEFAARGGLEQKVFPWGDELEPAGKHMMNVWQGKFPTENSLADGYFGTAPVNSFEPNGYGLFNMTGNVWEWTGDWFDKIHSAKNMDNPKGPSNGKHKVMKGGSYLCHSSYCRRYRVAARSGNTPDSSTGNIGFRCVVDVEK